MSWPSIWRPDGKPFLCARLSQYRRSYLVQSANWKDLCAYLRRWDLGKLLQLHWTALRNCRNWLQLNLLWRQLHSYVRSSLSVEHELLWLTSYSAVYWTMPLSECLNDGVSEFDSKYKPCGGTSVCGLFYKTLCLHMPCFSGSPRYFRW